MSDLRLSTQAIDTSGIDRKLAEVRLADRAEEDGKVARDVEALFARVLVKELRKGLGDGFFGQGAGSDTFEGWLDEQLGESLARDGVLDLAGRVRTSLSAGRAQQATGAESTQTAATYSGPQSGPRLHERSQ